VTIYTQTQCAQYINHYCHKGNTIFFSKTVAHLQQKAHYWFKF